MQGHGWVGGCYGGKVRSGVQVECGGRMGLGCMGSKGAGWGSGCVCVGRGGITHWLARGPPKAGLAASYVIK